MKKKPIIVQSARVDITVFIQDDPQGTVFCMIAPSQFLCRMTLLSEPHKKKLVTNKNVTSNRLVEFSNFQVCLQLLWT
jgi:hypothetical protein